MSDNKHLTTGLDLKLILASCKKCLNTINNGKNIITQSELPFLNVHVTSNNPIGFIVHTPSTSNLSDVGHWSSILISNTKTLIICDGLDYVTKHPQFMANVKKFAKNNGLVIVNSDVRCQEKNSFFLWSYSYFLDLYPN